MIRKADLVMWTKNGGEKLPLVLKRIDEVIPQEVVNSRIIVDDHSIDDTREVAESFGWQVVFNEGTGISDGANTALKQVSTEYFISFEQDLLLTREWWQKISRLIPQKHVAVASGIRVSTGCEALVKIEEYEYEECCRIQEAEQFDFDKFLCGKTLDNTMYKTAVIRSLGGFPKLPISTGVDTVLAYRVHTGGYKWKVDYTAKSTHLRKGREEAFSHRYWYGKCHDTLSMMLLNKPANLPKMMGKLFFSPALGLHIAVKKRCVKTVYMYPLVRFSNLKGIIDSRRNYGSH